MFVKILLLFLSVGICSQSMRLGLKQASKFSKVQQHIYTSLKYHATGGSQYKLSSSKLFARIPLSLKMGLLDGLKNAVGGGTPVERLAKENDQLFQGYTRNVEKINELEAEYESLSNDALCAKTDEFRRKLRSSSNQQQTIDGILVEAFAVVREASWRVLEMRHFDVQLIGGMALHDGKLAEMATGEGKTLVALLPIYLNALTGDGSFVVTTSDYLASRDGEMMGQVFRFLGLTVGIVQSYQKEAQRKLAYSSDVTYVSNQELGFDYLRDNLAMSSDNVVQQRPYKFCVVDEADSILIDEARTPLIISRKGNAPTTKYVTSAQIVKQYLLKGQHYEVNEKDQKVDMTPAGYKYAEQILGKNLYDLNDPWAFFLINAIKAKELYNRDKEYIVDANGGIGIIDTFSGRVLDGRRFTDGLQQSIEAKENLKVSSETQVVAKVTYQSLFRLFGKLAGMSGTLMTESQELQDVYGLKVFPIPTALPIARRDNPDAVFRTKNGKLKALLRNVLSTHDKGRPILIGTTSIENSEEMQQALNDLDIPCKLLNARPENVEKESEIVAQAGRQGAVTVATNMAGRGTDIILGGSAKGLVKVIVKQLLMAKLGLVSIPDFVAPKREKSVDVDESDDNKESNGRDVKEETSDFMKAIQESRAERKKENNKKSNASISSTNGKESPESSHNVESEESEPALADLESDADVLALPSLDAVLQYLDLSLPRRLKTTTELALKRAVISCADSLESAAANGSGSTSSGSSKVDRMSIEDLVARGAEFTPTSDPAIKLLRNGFVKATEEIEASLSQERELVKKLGGLYVVGTSRHESRRIDLQLRGRSGRQGDPGGTRFFLSLEDDIFKIFGADKLSGIMENFRVAEDMPIESDLVVQALDKVQTQVEDYYRSTRKQVYKLDEITSSQRNVVYSQRRAFLTSTDEGMVETFSQYCMQTMTEIYEASLVNTAAKSSKGPVNAEKLVSKSVTFFPNIKLSIEDIQQTSDDKILGLLLSRLQNAILAKRGEVDDASVNSWAFVSFFRYLAMVQTDESWCKHLTRLDLLKEEMVLQSFTAERDVIEVYREKALKLFETLLDDIRRNTVYSLFIYKPKK